MRRLLRPVRPGALAAAALLALAGLALAAPGEGVKKLRAAVDKLGRVEGGLARDDARLTEAGAAFDACAEQNDVEAARLLMGLVGAPFPRSAAVEVFVAERARDALIALDDAAARDDVRKAFDKRKKELAVAGPLADVLAAWGDDASLAAVAGLLEQKDDRVVCAGARALARAAKKPCVRPLIDAFGAWLPRGGEPLEAIGRALVGLTGQSFKTREDWLKWWETNEASWAPGQRAGGEAGATRTRPIQDDAPSLFESKVTSKKVVVILDVSGSMHIREFVDDPIFEGPPKAAPAEGSQTRDGDGADADKGDGKKGGVSLGGGPPLPPGVNPADPNHKKKPCSFAQCPGARGTGPACPSDEHLPDYYRRHDRLMRQVSTVVRHLRPDVRFNMIAFSTDARAWRKDALATADERTKRQALQWIESLQPNGTTCVDKALEAAFEVAEADTFIFVTDGAPTNPTGKPLDPTGWREILDEVKRKNKVRRVKIDVIAIAEGHTDFARNLAGENGGQYTTVR